MLTLMDVGGVMAGLVHYANTCKKCPPGRQTVKQLVDRGGVIEIRDRCEACTRFLKTLFFCLDQKFVVVAGESEKPKDFKTKAAGDDGS